MASAETRTLHHACTGSTAFPSRGGESVGRPKAPNTSPKQTKRTAVRPATTYQPSNRNPALAQPMRRPEFNQSRAWHVGRQSGRWDRTHRDRARHDGGATVENALTVQRSTNAGRLRDGAPTRALSGRQVRNADGFPGAAGIWRMGLQGPVPANSCRGPPLFQTRTHLCKRAGEAARATRHPVRWTGDGAVAPPRHPLCRHRYRAQLPVGRRTSHQIASAFASRPGTAGRMTFTVSDLIVPYKAGQPILEAATAAGIAIPTNSQMGLFSACKAHCMSGNVEMDGTERLEPAEQDAGFVLTCCGRPKGPIRIALWPVRQCPRRHGPDCMV